MSLFLRIAAIALCGLSVAQAQLQTTAGVEVIGVTPVEGSETDPDKIPAPTSALDHADLDHRVSSGLPSSLQQRVPSAQITDLTGNPFQPDVQYRGFSASPILGTPQGLAVYQNGVRTNESFGDTVNWDLLPEFAIESLDLVSNNPAFGLNALGGALAVQMKNGFNFHESEAEIYGGSFRRWSATAETGAARGDVAFYAGADALRDDGWRDRSPSDLRRAYVDFGFKANTTEVHLAFTGARNNFGNVGPTPLELLDRRWENVFTSPQSTDNELELLSGNFVTHLTENVSLESAIYYRRFRQSHIDGNISDDPNPDLPDDVLAGEIDHTSTRADTFGGSLQLTSNAALFGRENHFAFGGSVDRGEVTFSATPEAGVIDSDLYVTGNGEILDGEDVAPAKVRTTNLYAGIYFIDTISLTSQLALTAGARFNFARIRLHDLLGDELNGSEDFHHFNPLIGATYEVIPAMTVYAGYSEANRAPTPAELGCGDPAHPCVLDNFLVSDPPLRQVVAHTVEAGLRGKFSPHDGAALSWQLGYFRTDSSGDILNVAAPTPNRGYFVNAGDTRREGAEARIEYHDARWSLYATYSFLAATFQSRLTISSPNNPMAAEDGTVLVHPGDEIPLNPRHRFKAGADANVTEKWKLGAELVAFSNQYFEGDASNRDQKIPAYYVINLHTSYALTRQCELFSRVENLFDRRYYTAGTFFNADSVPALGLSDPRTVTPAAPLAVYGGLRVNW